MLGSKCAGKLNLFGIDKNHLVEFLRWDVARKKAKPIPILVEAFLLTKTDKEFSWNYHRELKRVLTKFAARFKEDIDQPTRAEVEAWLDSQIVAPRTWNNNLAKVISLYRFARREGHLSDSIMPVETIQRNWHIFSRGTCQNPWCGAPRLVAGDCVKGICGIAAGGDLSGPP